MAALPLFHCLIIGRRCSGGGWRDYCRWNAPDFPAAGAVMVHYGRSAGRAGRGQDRHAAGQPAAATPSLPRSHPSIDQMSLSCWISTLGVPTSRHPFFPSAFRLSSTAHAAAAGAAAQLRCVHGDGYDCSDQLWITSRRRCPTHRHCTYVYLNFTVLQASRCGAVCLSHVFRWCRPVANRFQLLNCYSVWLYNPGVGSCDVPCTVDFLVLFSVQFSTDKTIITVMK